MRHQRVSGVSRAASESSVLRFGTRSYGFEPRDARDVVRDCGLTPANARPERTSHARRFGDALRSLVPPAAHRAIDARYSTFRFQCPSGHADYNGRHLCPVVR